MKIHVLFFASLREAVGEERVALELADGSFAELRSRLTATLGKQSDVLWADNVRLARNQELLTAEVDSLEFADGDELAFLPPVTGG